MAYLTQLVDTTTFCANKINLLVAPCGSGKTKFAINYISSGKYPLGRILYVIDVNNNKDHFMQSYPNIFVPYDKSWMGKLYKSKENWVNFTNSPLFSEITGKDSKVTIINYTQLGALLFHYPQFYNMLDLIILDEPHHFYKYSARHINTPLSHAQLVHSAIVNMANLEEVEVLAITATPEKFIKYASLDRINFVKYDKAHLTRYLTQMPNFYTTPNIAIKEIFKLYSSPHILVYTPYIRSMLRLEELFTSYGLNAVCLWSRNNLSHPYSEKQTKVYNHLLEHNTLPSGINVVIINAAFETGMDILDKRFDIFWGQSSEVDSLIQSRGRIRNDIKHSVIICKGMYWEKIKENIDWGKEQWRKKEINITKQNETNLLLPKQYIGVFLTTTEKQQIVNILNLKDSRNRQLGWTKIKQYLQNNGFEVKQTTKRINGKKIRGDKIIELNFY